MFANFNAYVNALLWKIPPNFVFEEKNKAWPYQAFLFLKHLLETWGLLLILTYTFFIVWTRKRSKYSLTNKALFQFVWTFSLAIEKKLGWCRSSSKLPSRQSAQPPLVCGRGEGRSIDTALYCNRKHTEENMRYSVSLFITSSISKSNFSTCALKDEIL